MRLHGEPKIWRLHKVGGSNRFADPSKLLHLRPISDMLNHGIGVGVVKFIFPVFKFEYVALNFFKNFSTLPLTGLIVYNGNFAFSLTEEFEADSLPI